MRQRHQVVVVGAGPTGLALACGLALRGVDVAVCDAARGPHAHSRAVTMYPRTLELLDGLGVADAVIAGGVPLHALRLSTRVRQTRVALGPYRSRFPLCVVPQVHTERMLHARLAALGVVVDYGLHVDDVSADNDRVRVTVRSQDGGARVVDAAYVVGCDGPRSVVRAAAGIALVSAKQREVFDLADVDVDGFDVERGVADAVFSPRGALFVLPLPSPPGQARLRLIVHHHGAAATMASPTFTDVQHAFADRIGRAPLAAARLSPAGSVVRYVVDRQRAQRLVQGRVLVAGDAAHVHSPVAALGMNAGLADATTLAWRLATVVQGAKSGATAGAASAQLARYESERLAHVSEVQHTVERLERALLPRQTLMATVRDRWLAHLDESADARARVAALLGGFGVDADVLALSTQPVLPALVGHRMPSIPDVGLAAALRAGGFVVTRHRAATASAARGFGVPVVDVDSDVGAAYVLVRPDGIVAAVGSSVDDVLAHKDAA